MTYSDRVLDALGDPTRRLVFKRLRSGARSVGEIAEGMDVSRPAVSQHLRVLKARVWSRTAQRVPGGSTLWTREGSRPCVAGSMDSGTKRSARSKKRPNEK